MGLSITKRNESFEESIGIIDKLLNINKYKWQLHIVASMDWDDITQQIKLHLWKKWHLYDSSKQLEPWINTIINNQLKNIQRNMYYAHSRPCLRCVYNMGGEYCEWTKSGKQESECPLYKKWERGKKRAHDVKLPVSTENHSNEIMEMPAQTIDSERYINMFHEEMRKKLKPSLWVSYEHLYIQNLSEELLAKKLGFISHEKNRKPGYARIQQIKRYIIKIAQEVKNKIDFI